MRQTNAKSVLAWALLSALALAPAAQAAEINRNTGVGVEIAAQGNAALRYIRTALRIALPKLPNARPVKVSAPARVPLGGAVAASAGLRCAE